ncbi:hypothetical protein HDU82_000990 [Entophlyctis luteolus]|nr:hypothetical protein HDU82_000990 [Entophlyctis luteolus]
MVDVLDRIRLLGWSTFFFFLSMHSYRSIKNVIEVFSDFLLYWIPFYYAFKAILILYLVLPQFHGAKVVYEKVLEPYLLKKQSVIDADLSKIKAKAAAALGESAKQD